MASANIIHFGVDTCFRIPVLQTAGFQIEQYDVLSESLPALRSNPDAVLLEDKPKPLIEKAIA